MQLGHDLEARTTALTVAEVARILSVSERQIYKLAALDEIPCFRVGGSIRFDPFAISQWLRRASGPGKISPRAIPPLQAAARQRRA